MVDFNWDDAKSGAAVGAVAGTAVSPGIGTAVGGIGGGLIGGFGGFGGGLWNNLSGQSDPGARYGGVNEITTPMKENEARLKDWAYTGNGPSAAQDLLERNRSEGQQRALASAKSAAGGNPMLAGILANRQQAQVSADTGLQSATLRAQEQQNAMQAYQAALERRRQQNIEVAKAQNEQAAKNAENNSSFIGSLLGGAGNIMGGFG
jgi:hypothetical protein